MSQNTDDSKHSVADLTGTNPWPAIIITVGVLFILAAILVPTFRNTKLKAAMRTCASNLKRNSAAMIMYAEENDSKLPGASDWMDRVERYIPLESNPSDSFRCPAVGKTDFGYAMQDDLGYESLDKIPNPSMRPLLFESDNLVKNAHSATVSLPNIPRHRYSLISYIDGHVSFYVPGTLPKR